MRTALALAVLLPFTARAAEPIAAATLPATAATAGSVPDLRPRIYVKDLDHLAQIVSADPVVGTQARELSGRTSRANSAGVVAVLGAVLLATGGAVMTSDTDHRVGSPTFGERTSDRGPALTVVGGVTIVAALLYATAVMPRSDEFLDLVNAWNVRHPDEPLEILARR